MQGEHISIDLTGSTTSGDDTDEDGDIVICPWYSTQQSTRGPDIPLQKAADACALVQCQDLEIKEAESLPQPPLER